MLSQLSGRSPFFQTNYYGFFMIRIKHYVFPNSEHLNAQGFIIRGLLYFYDIR